jgi:hypothetical protein
MGEVFDALQVMNRTLKLGLTAHQMVRAEMVFKSEVAREKHSDAAAPTDPVALAEEYEAFVTLKRREKKLSLKELMNVSDKASERPAGKGEQKTLEVIDEALKKHQV